MMNLNSDMDWFLLYTQADKLLQPLSNERHRRKFYILISITSKFAVELELKFT
jgi:hypothetical protein